MSGKSSNGATRSRSRPFAIRRSADSALLYFDRFDEIIMAEENLLLPPTDPRVAVVKRVCDRLVQTLQDHSPLSCFSYADAETASPFQRKKIRVTPSARTEAAMLWMPEVSLVSLCSYRRG